MSSTSKPALPSRPSLLSLGAAIFLFSFLAVVLLPKMQLPPLLPLLMLNDALALLNTLFHEFGHIIFGFGGRALGVAGGTLAQILVPLTVMISALRQRTPFAPQVSLFWIGQNCIGISAYIADASGLQLEYFQWWAAFGGQYLEKGDPTVHDWHIMLGALHLLWADQILSFLVFGIGVLMMVAAAAWAYAPLPWWQQLWTERLRRR